jgi:type I restriction enzyme S subunit
MNPDWLLKHFDQISEAPDAVPRLRRFILDLAVRGKLVKQNPEDEPASELLKLIEVEKKRLEKDGVIRTPKSIAPIDETECLYGLPDSWKWVRLGEVGSITGGGTPPSKDDSCFTEGGLGVAWLTPADLGKHNNLFISHGARDLTEKGLADSSAQLMPAGTVLFTSRAPIGYTAIAANKISTNQGFKSVVPFVLESNRYIAIYFKAFASCIDGKASGTTFKEVSGKIVTNLPFPLPPLAEQNRIVAKVDQLMALCDEMETAQATRERRRNRLVATTLHCMNNGETNAVSGTCTTFEESARFYFNNLPRLTTRPEHIHQLHQTILNLAVRGKLVPQDPGDEAASELLKKIQVYKERLINAGELRKEKPLPTLSEQDVPFSIPSNWIWVRLGNCSLLTEYGTSVKSGHADDGVPVLKMGDIQGGRVLLVAQKKVPRSIDDLPQLYLKHYDLLYNRTNSAELVGKTGIFMGDDDAYTFASYLIRIRFISHLTSSVFVNLSMNAPYFRKTQILPELKQQCGQANVNGTKLKSMMIPLPPLAEQHRIVTKVEQLMDICEELESLLATTATTRRQLLEATIYEALSNPREVYEAAL